MSKTYIPKMGPNDILWRISPKIVRWLVSLNITPFQNLDKTHVVSSQDKLWALLSVRCPSWLFTFLGR